MRRLFFLEMNAETFLAEASLVLRSKMSNGGPHILERDFRAHFGVRVHVCLKVWEYCEDDFLRLNILPKHLLWGLLFLKTYATEPILASMAGVSRKTFRMWAWQVVTTIAGKRNQLVSLVHLLEHHRCRFLTVLCSMCTSDSLGEQISSRQGENLQSNCRRC